MQLIATLLINELQMFYLTKFWRTLGSFELFQLNCKGINSTIMKLLITLKLLTHRSPDLSGQRLPGRGQTLLEGKQMVQRETFTVLQVNITGDSLDGWK